MKASETRVRDFISQNKTQFIIPVYQRNYNWTEIQCKQLIDDIKEVGSNDRMNSHFIGSIVYVHDSVMLSSDLKELTIIDGQQRLTTLTLIYLAIYKVADCMRNSNLKNEIYDTYLINKYASEDEKLKLRPTDNNDKALKYLLRNDNVEEFPEYSNIINNFNYIKNQINENNYEYVLKGLQKLIFVEISLDRRNDEPQKIFESLNSTGLELSQADLIRNYILIGLNLKEQQKYYNNYWAIIESNAKDYESNISLVSDFIRDYLTSENKRIPNKNKVYDEFKNKYPQSNPDFENALKKMKTLSMYYSKLCNPRNEDDEDIREQLYYIKRLDINVAFPFLMKVYEDYGLKAILKEDFINILIFVQSFTWRRFIVGLPTNALNKIFMNLYDKIDKNNYVLSIYKSILQRSGVQRYPKDTETISSLKDKDMYNINPKNRLYFFERLENYETSEKIQIQGNKDITIEHIFPQNPDKKWKFDLNDKYQIIKDKYLNTIGNLTLSGNNGKLGNKTFKDKRDLKPGGYADSKLWLNNSLKSIDTWGEDEIRDRANIISDRFIMIWPTPTSDFLDVQNNNEVNIFEADEPKNKKLEYAIFLDQKIEVKEVSKLYGEVIKQLFELQPETFFTSDIGEKINIQNVLNKHNLRQPIKINETYVIEGNIDNNSKFDKLKYILSIFELQEELFIKYSDTQLEKKDNQLL